MFLNLFSIILGQFIAQSVKFSDSKNTNLNKYIKKSLKIAAWILGSIFLLLLLLVFFIQVPYVQNKLKNKAVNYLETKIGTDVNIGRIEIGFPKKIIIEDLYLESQQKDTLLFGKKIAVNISLLKLLSNKVEINSVDLNGITMKVYRSKKAVFNFDYIIAALDNGKPKDITEKPMQFAIDKINLDNINLRFDDAISNNNIQVQLTHFDTRIKKFDLDKMAVEVPKMQLHGLTLNLEQNALLEEIATKTVQKTDSIARVKPNFDIKLGTIALSKIKINYSDKKTKNESALQLKKLLIDFETTDFSQQLIAINSIELQDATAHLKIGKSIQKASPTPTIAAAANQWKVNLKTIDLKNIAFAYDDHNAKTISKGIDYQHLDIKNLNLEARDFRYQTDAISGSINAFAVTEKSGLVVTSLQTNFGYGPQGTFLKNFTLKTPQTVIRNEIIANYPSLAQVKNDLGNLAIATNLSNTAIAFSDILLFAPDLAKSPPFKDRPNAIIYLNGKINGRLNNMVVPYIEISGIGNTKLAASGKILGLPDMKKATFDIVIREFRSSAKDINDLLPEGTVPNHLQLPSKIALKGIFKGSIQNFNTNLILNSSLGNARIKGSFDQRNKNREKYDAIAELDNFDIGQLIQNNSLGKVSFKATIKGVGLDPKTANAFLDGTLKKGKFNNYTYQNLAVKGNITKGVFDVFAKINDPNLGCDMLAEGSFNGKYPEVKMKLNIDIADLAKLNLHAGPLKLRGKIDADIASLDADYLNGSINAYHFVIANEKEQFQMDSVRIIALATSEKSSLEIKSQFLKANIEGQYQLPKIATAVTNSLSKYYDANLSSKEEITTPQQFVFNITVDNDPILAKIIPKITRLEPLNISGRYNSINDSIVLNASIPRFVYGTNTISNAIIKIDKIDNALVYKAVIDEIQSDQFRLPHSSLEGTIAKNTIAYNLNLKDTKNKDHYSVAGTFQTKDATAEMRLLPESLLLNYEPWLIADNNVIRFEDQGIFADNFELKNEQSAITIQSHSTAADAPLAIDFKSFEIETITKMFEKENFVFGGTVNGNVLLKNLMTMPIFTSDLNIENFSFKKDTIGAINIKVNNEIEAIYAAKVTITGKENQVNLEGFYRNDNSSFDMHLDLQRLNMISIAPFSAGNITKSSGYLSGNFKLTGTIDQPKIIGDLQFHDVGFTVTKVNSPFKSMNDRISFTKEGIVFPQFSLSDAQDNVLSLKGNIYTPNYKDFAFDLTINADNFRVMNSSTKDNATYYGQLFLNARLNIKGDLNKPVVDGTVKINDATKFTVELPQNDPSIADREGIIEFIDKDNLQLTEKLIIQKDSLSRSTIKGMNVAVNIEIDKEAELTIIIDKGNGDFVKVKGEAKLSGGIDESGKTTLTGRYELKEGAYEMTFNFLKRKFEIQSGSSIVWTGEPTSADINITAVYKSNTAPIDLLEDQLGNLSQSQKNTYKQKLPFETLLKLNGNLLKPDITFDITLPEGNYGVASDILTTTRAKLAQLRQEPSELNKQVFAILLLNRFVGENPFASESGTSSSSLARQSVSKILSEQLNDLAGNLINGVEIDFDLESTDDYSSGIRQDKTDLSVAVSKKLLNDRLKVTVGSSFGLEGEAQANQRTNNIAGDIAADYQLSKDGKYLIRGYRKNEYQVALQGQIVETGLAFIITMDYNKFRELFHLSKAEKQMKSQAKKKKKEAKAQKGHQNQTETEKK